MQGYQTFHWRDTARPVRFFNLDARASFLLMLFLFHARLWTLILCLLVLLGFYIVERLGFDFMAALRALRLWFIGDERPARLSSEKPKMIDYGR